jgi:DNA-binding NarL/FixJ family response regulator
VHAKLAKRSKRTVPSTFIVSDIPLVRDGLTSQLERDGRLNVIGSGSASTATLATMGAKPANSVALDLCTENGLVFAEQLRSTLPNARVVGCAIGECDPQLAQWARNGICGYVEREGTAEDIVVAVLHVVKRELYCSPRFAAHLLTELAARATTVPPPCAVMASLTPREVQILQEIRVGASNKEIARELGISSATVKNHVHHLLEKLDIRRRAQASAILSALHRRLCTRVINVPRFGKTLSGNERDAART